LQSLLAGERASERTLNLQAKQSASLSVRAVSIAFNGVESQTGPPSHEDDIDLSAMDGSHPLAARATPDEPGATDFRAATVVGSHSTADSQRRPANESALVLKTGSTTAFDLAAEDRAPETSVEHGGRPLHDPTPRPVLRF
jgi:hypothetical protein